MHYCGMQYEEGFIDMKDWSQHKSSMPGGSMPVIEFPDGTKMG